ncbi:hypothetical protein KFK09_028703 [Dendrobium nobile]|uniref:DUF4283 domain-containing protein n=1 Tax=Dendrobium nobile TaxID=94219 RepID=A0A8T3A2N1_DENNO|nr:hypothetical protein KFK09_028703 [Dendrobium nobile]
MSQSRDDFPPFSKATVLGQQSATIPAPWTDNFSASESRSEVFPMTFVPPEQKLSFSTDDLSEDYNFVWSGGPWFLLGKPFVLQQWSSKFKPKRDESASVSIWIKVLDIPLALWTPSGISKIASYVGIPLTVNDLTAKCTHLNYARICVQISKDSKLHDEIPIVIEGEESVLKVVYDWKPTPCESCGSLIHPSNWCPSNPTPNQPLGTSTLPKQRGRSISRQHRFINRSKSKLPPLLPTPSSEPSNPAPVIAPNTEMATSSHTAPLIETSMPLNHEELNVPAVLICDNGLKGKDSHIPNLNFPTKELSSSEPNTSFMVNNGKGIKIANKFNLLVEEDSLNFNQESELEEISSIQHGKTSEDMDLSKNNSPSQNSPNINIPPPQTTNQKSTKAKNAKKAKPSSSKSR